MAGAAFTSVSGFASSVSPWKNVEQPDLSPERATFDGKPPPDVAPLGLEMLARYQPGIFIPGYTTLPLRGKRHDAASPGQENRFLNETQVDRQFAWQEARR